ncbi:hypothetical protein APHAL10511_008354, partial [Amanita phalloides]
HLHAHDALSAETKYVTWARSSTHRIAPSMPDLIALIYNHVSSMSVGGCLRKEFLSAILA